MLLQKFQKHSKYWRNNAIHGKKNYGIRLRAAALSATDIVTGIDYANLNPVPGYLRSSSV